VVSEFAVTALQRYSQLALEILGGYMPFPATVVSIFLSSPSDVKEDRSRIVSIIQAWNQRNGRERSLFFNVLTWEDFVAPAIGESGQEVVNEQVGDDYDIFLGVMWSRFGTPTSIAKSGTEEEFNRVVDRHRLGEGVSVCFLFKNADIPMKILDGEQFISVRKFKEFVSDSGCLYREYVDDASLINSMNLILDRFANAQSGLSKEPQRGSRNKGQRAAMGAELAPSSSISKDDDEGLFEINDRIEVDGREFVQSMEDWSKRLNSAGDVAVKVTDELNTLTGLGLNNSSAVRVVIKKMTDNMADFADWGEVKIGEIENIIDRYSDSLLRLVDISRDFPESAESMEVARDLMFYLSDQIVSNARSMNEFIGTLKDAPRLSKPMIKATRRLVDIHERLVAKNEIFRSNVLEIAAQIDAMIKGRATD